VILIIFLSNCGYFFYAYPFGHQNIKILMKKNDVKQAGKYLLVISTTKKRVKRRMEVFFTWRRFQNEMSISIRTGDPLII